jgi:uncharacterized membrane protein YeaQ/YmgE (transglycosylase-associated protein family)
MSIFTWIVLGLSAGWIASKLVNRTSGRAVVDIVLGIAGACIGGSVFSCFRAALIRGLGVRSSVLPWLDQSSSSPRATPSPAGA